MKATTIQILESSNYEMFKPHGEQQKMAAPHVKRIKVSMTRNGFIKAKPIHCYRDGKFLRIIDGHHRLRAAQELGIPVYYVIGGEEDRDLIADENWAVRKWTSEAFVGMYVSRGVKDYITLAKYISCGLDLKFASALLSGESTASGNQAEAIRRGGFKVKTTKNADRIISIIERAGEFNEIAKSQQFVACLCVLVNLDWFSETILIKKIKDNPRCLVRSGSREQMMDQIEEIYNFKQRDKINLAFLAKEWLRSRTFKPASN